MTALGHTIVVTVIVAIDPSCQARRAPEEERQVLLTTMIDYPSGATDARRHHDAALTASAHHGRGNHLRLRTLGDWEAHPIEALRECCRAETALEKAMLQTVNMAREASHSWTEIGDALGVTKQTAWQRFSGGLRHPITGEAIEREGDSADE